jgi:hypothetical protein
VWSSVAGNEISCRLGRSLVGPVALALLKPAGLAGDAGRA